LVSGLALLCLLWSVSKTFERKAEPV